MLAGIVTAILMALFLGGWVWAWAPSRRRAFEDAARLPLEDDEVRIVRTAAAQQESGA